jgi:hypothetical protein
MSENNPDVIVLDEKFIYWFAYGQQLKPILTYQLLKTYTQEDLYELFLIFQKGDDMPKKYMLDSATIRRRIEV